MRRRILISLTAAIVLSVVTLTSCTPSATSSSSSSASVTAAQVKSITAKDAKARLDQKGTILLDVRTEEEYKQQRIAGSILIPDTEIKARAAKELPDKNATIIVYCRSGRRSALAAKDLIAMGYTNVYDLGGITKWTFGTISG